MSTSASSSDHNAPELPVSDERLVEISEDISTEKIWEALLIKIETPNIMLPVTDVVTRPSDDGLGTYREMTLGPNRIIENIYSNKSTLEIVFDMVNDDSEIVNIIHIDEKTGKRSLEFFKRNSTTKERVVWTAPVNMVIDAIKKTIDHARSL